MGYGLLKLLVSELTFHLSSSSGIVLQFVFPIREDDCRFETLGLFEVHGGVGDDDHDIADGGFAGGGTVQTDHTGIFRPLDDVGFQPFAVVDVQHLHFLVLDHVGGLHQRLVNGDAAHVVQIRLRDGGLVYFRFQDFYVHFIMVMGYRLLVIEANDIRLGGNSLKIRDYRFASVETFPETSLQDK